MLPGVRTGLNKQRLRAKYESTIFYCGVGHDVESNLDDNELTGQGDSSGKGRLAVAVSGNFATYPDHDRLFLNQYISDQVVVLLLDGHEHERVSAVDDVGDELEARQVPIVD